MKYPQISIGNDAAIVLAKTKWWVGRDPREVTRVQLFTVELCMDFAAFHEALEKSLGRPVFTHELGMNFEGIVQEFLGERDAPTMEEILELIPAQKRIVISTS